MNLNFKKGAMLLLMGCFTLNLVSCDDDDDPNYDSVTPPEVSISYSVSGQVVAISGEGLKAKVYLNDQSIDTQADGTFTFANLKAGDYTLKAEAAGKNPVEKKIQVNQQNNAQICQLILSNIAKEIAAQADGSLNGEVKSETAKGNEKAAIHIEIEAEAKTLPKDVKISMRPIYTENEASTKADTRGSIQSKMLIGSTLTCSDPSFKLPKPIKASFQLDPAMSKVSKARKLVNGQWKDVKSEVKGNEFIVEVDDFGSYGIFFDAEISRSETYEGIPINPDDWNNLNGTSPMKVEKTIYSYKVGSAIDVSNNDDLLIAYLNEVLIHMGGTPVRSYQALYALNVTLPIGTGMRAIGKQQVSQVTITGARKSASAKTYHGVTITTETYNRQHTGGGSL